MSSMCPMPHSKQVAESKLPYHTAGVKRKQSSGLGIASSVYKNGKFVEWACSIRKDKHFMLYSFNEYCIYNIKISNQNSEKASLAVNFLDASLSHIYSCQF